MSKVWFVVHRYNLWKVNNRIIGFWDKNQWNQIHKNDFVIYHRAQCQRQIKGIFKVICVGKRLRNNFSEQTVHSKKLIYQCRLKLCSEDVKLKRAMHNTSLSFYKDWENNCYGRYKKQIFNANQNDLNLILRNPAVIGQC